MKIQKLTLPVLLALSTGQVYASGQRTVHIYNDSNKDIKVTTLSTYRSDISNENNLPVIHAHDKGGFRITEKGSNDYYQQKIKIVVGNTQSYSILQISHRNKFGCISMGPGNPLCDDFWNTGVDVTGPENTKTMSVTWEKSSINMLKHGYQKDAYYFSSTNNDLYVHIKS
ncbi:MAG: hypothetical protein ACO2ZM_02935 [Francisellaceae bacterium]